MVVGLKVLRMDRLMVDGEERGIKNRWMHEARSIQGILWPVSDDRRARREEAEGQIPFCDGSGDNVDFGDALELCEAPGSDLWIERDGMNWLVEHAGLVEEGSAWLGGPDGPDEFEPVDNISHSATETNRFAVVYSRHRARLGK